MHDHSRHVDFCPHCGNRAPQRVVFEHSYQDAWFSSSGDMLPKDEGPESEAIICVCETCAGILVYDGIAYSESGAWPELVYPRGASIHRSAPKTVQAIYREAATIKTNAPNAFAILIRKGLEAICDDRGAPTGSLADRLRFLARKGEIPPVLSEVTDALRLLGNTAAHGSLQVIKPPMTWAIDDLFRAVVEYVYVAPSKLEALNKRLMQARSDG